MIKTCFKFDGKIPNDSKVIKFTRNHTNNDDTGDDDEDDDGTKNNMSPPEGGGDIILCIRQVAQNINQKWKVDT